MSASRVWALYLVVYLLRSLISYIFLIISLLEALHPAVTSLISSSEHIEHIDLIEADLPFEEKRLFFTDYLTNICLALLDLVSFPGQSR